MKARQIQESEIMHAPPHVREIWDLFLLKASHKNGKDLQRGQLRITYSDIREALHWMVGWRKMRYSKWHCEGALKWLRKATMITTKKTTTGMIITVCNYDIYQDPQSYESHNTLGRRATRKPQTTETIYKNVKNVKNAKKEINGGGLGKGKSKRRFIPPSVTEVQKYATEKNYNLDAKKFVEWYTESGWLDNKGEPVKNWKLKVISWSNRNDARTQNNRASGDQSRRRAFAEQESAIGTTITNE